MGDRAKIGGGRCPADPFYTPNGVCWQPYVKGLTIMVASIYNGNRREDIWLDK